MNAAGSNSFEPSASSRPLSLGLTKLEEQARAWLSRYQAPFEQKLQSCPRYFLDSDTNTFVLGDLFFDRYSARLALHCGSYDPHKKVFKPDFVGLHQDCQQQFIEALEKPPLNEVSELKAPLLQNIELPFLWTLLAALASCLQLEAIHLLCNRDESLTFILIHELREIEPEKDLSEQRKLEKEDLQRVLVRTLLPFNQALEEALSVESESMGVIKSDILGELESLKQEFAMILVHMQAYDYQGENPLENALHVLEDFQDRSENQKEGAHFDSAIKDLQKKLSKLLEEKSASLHNQD